MLTTELAIKISVTATLILISFSGPASAAEYPSLIAGKYIDAKDSSPQACENPKMVIEPRGRYNDFDVSCMPSRVRVLRATSAAARVLSEEKCVREDATWNVTATFEPGPVDQLVVIERSRYQGMNVLKLKRCSATTPPVATSLGRSHLPQLCRDEDQVGGAKKIYDDKELTRLSEDIDSSGSMFTPEQEHKVGSMVVYQGTVSNFLNGRDVQGVYFIDAKEWAAVCK